MKELFIQAHEELIEEYLEKHPNADPDLTYDVIPDKAILERYRDKYADMVDEARMRHKEGQ